MDKQRYDDLVRKIRLQRGLHRYYEQRSQHTATLIKFINIVLPAHIIFAVFSDMTDLSSLIGWIKPLATQIFIGVAGFILFITSVLTEVFRGDRKYLDHRKAIERYTELLQEIHLADVRDGDVKSRPEYFETFNKRYLQITVTSPTFTDRQFETAMGYLLRSKALRLARKERPFARWWQLRRVARQKVADVLADENDPLYGYPFRRAQNVEAGESA